MTTVKLIISIQKCQSQLSVPSMVHLNRCRQNILVEKDVNIVLVRHFIKPILYQKPQQIL